MEQGMVKKGEVVERTLTTAPRGYTGYPRYRVHNIADPPTQLVQGPGGVNHPCFCLIGRQRLDQPRPLHCGPAWS